MRRGRAATDAIGEKRGETCRQKESLGERNRRGGKARHDNQKTKVMGKGKRVPTPTNMEFSTKVPVRLEIEQRRKNG